MDGDLVGLVRAGGAPLNKYLYTFGASACIALISLRKESKPMKTIVISMALILTPKNNRCCMQRMVRRLFVQIFGLVMCVLLLSIQPAYSLDAKSLFKNTRNSVVLVMSFDANNQPLALGSGFFVGDGKTVATNYHVIESASSVTIKLMSGKVAAVDTVVGVDIEHDLVLLSVPSKGSPLKLAERTPEVGEDIVVIGNPKGLEGTLSRGIVSGAREEKGSLFYQITAPISPGSSGGPIISEQGEVLGIASFYVQGGQNLNFAMPSAFIHRLLRKPETKTLAAVTRKKAKVAVKETVDERVKIHSAATDGAYRTVSASVFNGTDSLIKNVRMVVVFYCIARDLFNELPLHYMLINVKEEIPPGLAIRFKRYDGNIGYAWDASFRILDYDIIGQPGGVQTIPTFQ